MTIHLATDHAGFLHKEAVKEYLLSVGMEVIDHGALELVESDDYPDFILPAAVAVAADNESMGFIFGWSGQGEAMAANRVPGVRAVVYYGGPAEILTLTREHNNANILSIGAHFVSIEETLQAIHAWSSTPFSNDERHLRRLGKF
ncbi:MAG TPA: RpiB/LacA/LacB family sugar-phosphate isomerase [Candidatus Paceibacterota bacterium]